VKRCLNGYGTREDIERILFREERENSMNKILSYGLIAGTTCSLGSLASADVIMDQIGSWDGANVAAGTISASQDFDEYGAYDVVAMDNFSASSAMNLSSASMVIGGWNGYAGTDGVIGYTVSIFSSVDAAAGSIYGDVMSLYFDAGAVNSEWAGDGTLISFDLGGYSIAAGDYYIGITPANVFGTNGQTGVYSSDIGDNSGYQANPTGAFGFITQATGLNYAYALEGDFAGVPAPGAIALLGLCGVVSRRRRK